jgi:hypothetical protein
VKELGDATTLLRPAFEHAESVVEAYWGAWGQTFIFESPPLARGILTNWAYSTGLGPWNSDQMGYSTGRAGTFRNDTDGAPFPACSAKPKGCIGKCWANDDSMGQAGREKIKAYSLNRVIQQMSEIYARYLPRCGTGP